MPEIVGGIPGAKVGDSRQRIEEPGQDTQVFAGLGVVVISPRESKELFWLVGGGKKLLPHRKIKRCIPLAVAVEQGRLDTVDP